MSEIVQIEPHSVLEGRCIETELGGDGSVNFFVEGGVMSEDSEFAGGEMAGVDGILDLLVDGGPVEGKDM